MKITIIAVGKIKEKFYKQAIEEYAKRLSKYCTFHIIEVADEKTPEALSKTEEEMILKKEGERIRKAIRPEMLVFTLSIKGKSLDSVAFSKEISDACLRGHSHLAFIIGGSLGLDKEIEAQAHMAVSFSAMTFPHQLMRVILSEQIYRSFRIIHQEPYHK